MCKAKCCTIHDKKRLSTLFSMTPMKATKTYSLSRSRILYLASLGYLKILFYKKGDVREFKFCTFHETNTLVSEHVNTCEIPQGQPQAQYIKTLILFKNKCDQIFSAPSKLFPTRCLKKYILILKRNH